ncbi:MAG: hypothetical protein K2O52_03455 [Oscillospiraceae bacterium]|nr:hypothetical protein [Oscillospiraceae bacterium]MDE7093952.1 hypothetical protein [Oscillospiraceae bacterium]
MGKYLGFRCIVCNEDFKENDDIVVCPDCGTPYHRNCWQKNNACVNHSLHAVGGSWQSVQNEYRKNQGGKECPHCGFVNLPDAKNCNACGMELYPQEQQNSTTYHNAPEGITITTPDGKQHFFNAADPCCGMSPDDEIEGERLGDVASFVKTNTLYYIPLFKRFKETNRKLSFNLPCILFPYFYFANRKMWFMSILSGLLWIITSIPNILLSMLEMLTDKSYMAMLDINERLVEPLTAFLISHESLLEQLQIPCFFLGMLLRIGLCLFGNYLYFRFVIRSVKYIRQNAPTPKIKKMLLKTEGGTNIWNVLGCFGLYFGIIFFAFCILTAQTY